MSNVSVNELIGSGAGGGGASWSNTSSSGGAPQSQADCDPFNALFIPAAYNGTGGKNLCVTKYNVGDTNGPTIASSVKTVTAGGSSCSANECCWKGTTSSNCIASGSWSGHTTSYSGCTRTVCNWNAANASCQSWAPNGTSAGDWRLPTQNEMKGWANNIQRVSTYLGSDGLQLCDQLPQHRPLQRGGQWLLRPGLRVVVTERLLLHPVLWEFQRSVQLQCPLRLFGSLCP